MYKQISGKLIHIKIQAPYTFGPAFEEYVERGLKIKMYYGFFKSTKTRDVIGKWEIAKNYINYYQKYCVDGNLIDKI